MDDRIGTNPLLRSLVVIVPALVLAVFIGTMIGNGDVATPLGVLAVAVAVCGLLMVPGVRAEAWILGFLLAGYIMSQGSFAHWSLSRGMPLFFGELGLMGCVAALLARIAFTRVSPIPPVPLAYAICAFILIGGARLLFDLQTGPQKLTVLRDFATVYYASFFFIGFAVCKSESSRRFLERVLTISLIVLCLVYPIFFVAPGLSGRLHIGHYPLAAFRSDLTGSFMGFAAVWFFLRGQQSRAKIRWTLLSVLCICVILLALSRAVFVAFAVGALLLVLARRAPFIGLFAAIATVAVILVLLVEVVQPGGNGAGPGGDSFASVFRDKLVSVVDPLAPGKQQYRGQVGEWSAGNNRFRTQWWTAVFNETMELAPITGLGFGYDLARRFERSYDAPLPEESTTRSPHSILFTVLGRMGIVGLLAFLYIVYLIFRSALRCASAVARGRAPAVQLAFWAGVVIIFVSSCFGVMLEGPMAAIPFWTLLGIAAYDEWQRSRSSEKLGTPMRATAPSPRFRPMPELVH